MATDFSCGVIPVRVVDGVREFLLVKHKAGHWSFPKGHPDDGESHVQTALRELKEETGIARVDLDEDRSFEETYDFTKRSGKRVRKRVVYFLGRVSAGQSIRLQASEVADYAWGDAAETRERMSFDEGRALLDRAVDHLDRQTG
ncbi:MAG: bis(5'-nucleosyl)-tetraphosphatase [Phycisphaeraceae bacterium]